MQESLSSPLKLIVEKWPCPQVSRRESTKGFNSEKWAESVYSAIGTAVRVPVSEDLGLDLYCTLLSAGYRLLVLCGYYAVQVKSRQEPWVFKNQREVRRSSIIRWRFSIASSRIRKAHVSIFHTMPRFYAWASPQLPNRLELIPGKGTVGQSTPWDGGERYSLDALILEFHISRILEDVEFRATAAGILKYLIEPEYPTRQP